MSIIEKAANRLDRSKLQGKGVEPAAQAVALAVPEDGDTAVIPQAVQQAALQSSARIASQPSVQAASQPAPQSPAQAAAQSDAAVAPAPAVPAAQAASAAPARESARAVIDLDQLHRRGMVTPDAGRTPIAEEFRIIKRPLLRNAFGPDAAPHSNLIMVTSALPGEGKTFCAVNLAMSIAAERDHTVLLVDADVARPSVPRYLGLDAREGLMDVLLEERLDLADVMLRTNVDTLRILPAGRPHKNATELLASLTMSALLDEISRRYADRLVIFDSPPLLITSEARVLASRMGHIVMVVEAETTTRNAVRDALRHLGRPDNVSLIYNKSKAFAGVENYGYGYE